jgi:hypothetical protein
MKLPLQACLLALAIVAPLPARADPSEVPAARTENGYKYVFKDDPLAATSGAPVGALIRVVPGAARQVLIRPRTNFVPELLKSTESL